ncbi:MAG: 4Fe-4S binding protein [Deltaproteobacteria bacterium]|nr:4Fe-4S binding protein [Deltaproteobacteria bacterium]
MDFWRLHGWRHPFLFLHAIYYFGDPRKYIAKLIKIFNFVDKHVPKRIWQLPFIKPIVTYLPGRYHGKVLTIDHVSKIINLNEDIQVDVQRAKRVLTYEHVNQIVINSPDTIALGDCICRSLVENPCKPNHVCMFIGEPFSTYAVKRGKKLNIHYATKEEALDAIRQAHEAGFVHNAFFKDAAGDRLFALCNCCSCCCKGIELTNIFKDIYASDVPTPRMVEPSGYFAVHDDDRCIGCGTCEDACHFNAVTMVSVDGGQKARIDHFRCFGCGICVDKCESGAIRLVKDPYGTMPLDMDQLLDKK